METTSFLKNNAFAIILAAVTLTSSFVMTQVKSGDNTRRIENLEKYTRVTESKVNEHETFIAVLQEQQKTQALTAKEISTLQQQTIEELKATRLELARLSSK